MSLCCVGLVASGDGGASVTTFASGSERCGSLWCPSGEESKTKVSETPQHYRGGMEPCEPQVKPGMLSTRAGAQDQMRGADPCGVERDASQVYEPQLRQFQDITGDSLADPSENNGATRG